MERGVAGARGRLSYQAETTIDWRRAEAQSSACWASQPEETDSPLNSTEVQMTNTQGTYCLLSLIIISAAQVGIKNS